MYAAVENNAGNVPAFLIKLWTLVEDPSTDELIHWDSSGTSFHVYDQQRLSREILPLYFKHNNIASFIRQLNMYGFRKVTHIDQGGLKIEKDDLQFQHQYFQRGEQDMLQYIKRKVSSNQAFRATDQQLASDEVSRVLTDVKQVKMKQETIDHDLEYIKRENKLLWREVALLRQKHHKQQQIVNKLIQFLVSLVSSNRTGLTIPTLRRIPLAINDVGQITTQNTPSPAGVPHPGSPENEVQRPVVSSPSPNAAVKKEELADENAYNIESPKIGDYLLSPTPTSGPIIHELPDQTHSFLVPANDMAMINQNAPATTSQVNFLQSYLVPNQVNSVAPTVSDNNIQTTVTATDGSAPNFLMSPKIELAPSLEDALNFGLNVTNDMITTSNATVTTHPQTTTQTAQAPQSGAQTIQVVRPVTLTAQVTQPSAQVLNPASKATVHGIYPVTLAAINVNNSTSQATINALNRITQPTIQANHPVSQATININNPSPQQTIGQVNQGNNVDVGNLQRRKRPSADTNAPELGGSPQKKIATQKQYQQQQPIKQGATSMSQAQAASLNSLVMANSEINSTGQTQQEGEVNADGSMAVTASKDNAADELNLSSDQLDLLSNDLDGLKGILQDQYKVDPAFLMELFDSSNPWPLGSERELAQLSAEQDDEEESAGDAGYGHGNITGTELVEYNPRDELFPELLVDHVMGDIDDID